MTGDLIQFGLSIYEQNPSVFFALISSVIILTFALLMSNNFRNQETRVVLVVVPLALGTYLLSVNLENIERDFFQNLSTEFIGGLLALFLFANWIISHKATFPIVALAIFAVSGVFVWQAALTNDGFYVNLSTELLGALITTAVVRREWLWSSQVRIPHKQKHAYFEHQRRKVARDTAREMCDVQILVTGNTSEEIDARIYALLGSIEVLMAEDKTSRNEFGQQQRILFANCRHTGMLKPTEESVTIFLDGKRQAVDKTHQRMSETFEIATPDDESTYLTETRTQLRLRVKTPVQSFEQELHGMVEMFVERWHGTVQTSKPSEAYADGYHDAIAYVCDDLRATIKST